MWKVLRRLLLGSGQLPAEVRANLQAESIDVLEEDLGGSITYRNYRAPGRYSSWRRTGISGAVVLTSQRVLVYSRAGKLLDIPYDHPLLREVAFTLDAPDRLTIAFEASAFHNDRSGQIELRLRTAQAARIVQLIQQRAGQTDV